MKSREIGTFHILGVQPQAVRQRFASMGFKLSSSTDNIATFESRSEEGTKIGKAAVIEIEFEINPNTRGTAVRVTYRSSRELIRSQIRLILIFVSLGIASVLLGMALHFMFFGAILATVGFTMVCFDILRAERDVRDWLSWFCSDFAQSLGGYSVLVPSRSRSWTPLVGLGVFLVPLVALVPQLLGTRLAFWVVMVGVFVALWLVMLAEKLVPDGLMWPTLIAFPRVLLLAGIGFVLVIPALSPVNLPLEMALLAACLTTWFVLIQVLPAMKRVAKVAMVRVAYDLDLSSGEHRERSGGMLILSRASYMAAVAILAGCLYCGLVVSLASLLGFGQLGPAMLNSEMLLASLPGLVLLGVQQVGAWSGVKHEPGPHLEQLSSSLRKVRQHYAARGWLSDEDVTLSAPIRSMRVIGPAVLCKSSVLNQWVIVLPPWFADLDESHAEVLLAHELAHVSCHGLKTRWWRAIGCLSLVGVGGLLPLMDLEAEEDEADSRTLEYIRDVGLPCSSLRAAVLALGSRRVLLAANRRLEKRLRPEMTSYSLLMSGNLPINSAAVHSLRGVGA